VEKKDDPRRALPGVDTLLAHPLIQETLHAVSPQVVTAVIREVLAEARDEVQIGTRVVSHDQVARLVAARIGKLLQPSPKRVINGTGIILHTGLGRAPLPAEARSALQAAAGFCDLEIDLETGGRGDRQEHVEALLRYLTGAEAALVVNNNAAALYLTLNVLAYRREVVVSRGQLIEIGGSFRLPDIMARAGVKLVEVGTTNRTRIGDYRAAITPKTALLLRAHPSNYRIVGFTESAPLNELVALGKDSNVPVVDDIGNGLLWDWTELGLPSEENVRASLQAGVDLVLVSGDKVLGGPQAGIILGRAVHIRALKKNPLARVLRADKLAIAALAATLRSYVGNDPVEQHIPVWKMLTTPLARLQVRARTLCDRLAAFRKWQLLEVHECESEAGSGTLPAVKLPSAAICMLPNDVAAHTFAKRLRTAAIPVFGTVRQDLFWLDVRTLADDDDDLLVKTISRCLGD
jgi:L-seryl-tRNA(Ser) seleniumtransferase